MADAACAARCAWAGAYSIHTDYIDRTELRVSGPDQNEVVSGDQAHDPVCAPAAFTVLMPVFNGEAYIRLAIDSILAQTWTRFEFLIIDDGSTDSTAAILDEYAARDARIRVIHQDNIDQPATLNRGLREASHDWVAIIDHDDIALARRLEQQATAIACNPDARVIGTYGIEINSAGKKIGEVPLGPVTVDDFWRQRRQNAWITFVHSSVVLHRPTVLALGGYREAFSSAADSDLWSRVADYHPVISVPENLVLYRVHSRSMSFTRYFDQQRAVRWIRACQNARRTDRTEPTLAAFIASERGWLGIRRLKLLRYDWMMYFLRRRRLYRSEGEHLRGCLLFLAAAALDPLRAARQVIKRL